jgi:DNA polymerase III epsilon subunit-like protein
MDKLNLRPYKGMLTFFDTETAPNIGDFWKSAYQQNVSSEQIILERQMISIQWKKAGDKTVEVRTWTMPSTKELKDMRKFIDSVKSIPDYNKDAAFHLLASCAHTDKHIIHEIVDVLRSSYIVIGQNSDRFDIPWVKGRAMFHRDHPLTNIITLDTLKLSRKNFNLNSHSLNYLSKFVLDDSKMSTKYGMWQKVMEGDVKTLNDLCNKYGKKDVVLLENVFCEMVPHCNSLPVRLSRLINDEIHSCPLCASLDVQKNGFRVKGKTKLQRWLCRGCGHDWPEGKVKEDKIA